jgi:tetratricopeptide (TPR) repeat protein
MDATQKEKWKEINALPEDAAASRIELLRQLVQAYPDYAAAHYRLGRALLEVSRFDQALPMLQRALTLHPKEKRRFVYTAIGTLFEWKGDDAAAQQWFQKAIDEFPDDTEGYIYLGILHAKRGRLAEAERAHRRGTLCRIGCIDEAYLNLGYILRAQERYEEAAACFQHAIDIDPEYDDAILAKTDVVRAIQLRASSAPIGTD